MNLFARTAVTAITSCVSVVLVVTGVFFFGPSIERALFPVVNTTNVIRIPNQSDTLRLLLTTVKERESCELISRVVSVRMGPETWARGTILFKDPITGEFTEGSKTRPAGDRIMDEAQVKPKGLGVHIVLFHRCHPFWTTTTTQTYIETLK